MRRPGRLQARDEQEGRQARAARCRASTCWCRSSPSTCGGCRRRQYEFYFLLTPLFHSLQYLAFVYRMEETRLRSERHRELKGTALVGIIAAGWLAFEFVPNTLDNVLGTFAAWQMFFFFTAAMLFINIHHYFLDNVLWRFRDPQVRAYLLS